MQCDNGLTLSPAIVLAYLIKERGITLKSAYTILLEKTNGCLSIHGTIWAQL